MFVASASFLLLFLPGLLGPYGFFIDEYYYFACSERLAFGYVDHPPLAPFVLRAVRFVLGDSLLAFRLPAALAGAATALVAAAMARRLGAGGFGQAIAATCVAVSPLLQIMFGFFSMNAFSVLLWATLGWILIEIEARGQPQLWILFGAVAGLALQNKHTVVLFAGGLAIGLLATPARKHIFQRWLWLGVLIASLFFLPNVVWQVSNDWPSLEFYRNADAAKNIATPALEAAKQQILFHGPGTFPVWAIGLGFLLFAERARSWRHIGWVGLVLLIMMLTSGKSRPDRIAALYPMLFAAGAVPIDAYVRAEHGRWVGFALPALLLLSTILLLPLSVPILPIDLMAAYASKTGIVPKIEAGEGKVAALPQWFADRTGWENHVRDVKDALQTLTTEEREGAPVIVPSYGHGGSLELHAEELGNPPVHCGQNSYWLWGPPAEPYQAAIVVGSSENDLRELFAEVQLFRTTTAEDAMSWRRQTPVWIVRRPKVSIAAHWIEWKHYE